ADPAGQPAFETVEAINPPLQPLPPEENSAGVTRFSFLVYGDTRGRRDGRAEQYEHSLVIDSMLDETRKLAGTPFPVRFVLQTGDAVVKGTDPRQWNVSFVQLINRLTTEAGIPYFLVPGNHDLPSATGINSPNRQAGLANYLAAVNRLIPADNTTRRLTGYPTYAFGYGNTFIIALDTTNAADETQFNWVREQVEGLDRNRYRHVIAFFHHPAFSSGPHGGAKVEPPTAEVRNRYMPFFREHQFDVLFTGHEHLFEHWVEHYEADGKIRRLDQIVTGGGGAPLYAYHGEPDLRAYLETNTSAKVRLHHLVKPGPQRGDNPYHYLIVRVDGEHLSLRVVGVDWGKDFRPYSSSGVGLEDEPEE
ncbi:MAG: metallophosphoesterase, partial [Burkholderiales bacterium]